MNWEEYTRVQSRRNFLRHGAGGFGMLALADLLTADGLTAASGLGKANPLAAKQPHHAPKAKQIIFMFMAGGPSQYELFDEKPILKKFHNQPLPPSLTQDMKLTFIQPTAAVMASSFQFRRYGESGMNLSELLPHLGGCADDICLVRSMRTDAFNHHPAQLLLFTGHTQLGRPTLGAWTIYGLGSVSENLPAFVVLTSGRGTSGGASNFSSGFLPSHYQGTVLRNTGEPIAYLSNPKGITHESQSEALQAIKRLNELHYEAAGDLEIASRISSYELAFRMQMAAPELLDFSGESAGTRNMYGIDSEDPEQHRYATNCLLARRMVERGVRFVLMMDGSWDDHTEIRKKLRKRCRKIDKPTAALLKDLKQRGLLDETLVVWSGEFGRTPIVELRRPGDDADSDYAGRDHQPGAYSMWVAGGGIQGGQVVGESDEFGLKVVKDPVHVHDLQATLLHCLGFEHTRLTYRHMGREFRLTDVGGEVVKKLLA